MIDIGGTLINPAHIASAQIDTSHYVNGSASWLVLTLANGKVIRYANGPDFNVWQALEKIREAGK